MMSLPKSVILTLKVVMVVAASKAPSLVVYSLSVPHSDILSVHWGLVCKNWEHTHINFRCLFPFYVKSGSSN